MFYTGFFSLNKLTNNCLDVAIITAPEKRTQKTIEKLKPGQKQAVKLYDIEGYSHEEIAGILNVSINTTKSQLSRGRKRIKELLNN